MNQPLTSDSYLNDVVSGYVDAALWATNDESDESGGVPLDRNYYRSSFTKDAWKWIVADCKAFVKMAGDLLETSGLDADKVGHNFFLSRNGHGSGFSDEGTSVDEELQNLARRFGNSDPYLARGKLYVFPHHEAKIHATGGGKRRSPRLGSGGRFAALTDKLRARGAYAPKALAAWIGRKTLGAKKMAQLSAAGRKRAMRGGGKRRHSDSDRLNIDTDLVSEVEKLLK